MKRTNPLLAAATLLFALAFLLPQAFAQPGPGGPPGEPGPPPWAGEPGPPPFADPPDDPGPPGDDDDDNDDGHGGHGPPDFCSAGGVGDGPDGQAGRSSIAHLNFSQQDIESGEPVEDGAWGRIMYRWHAPLFDFVFNGHELPPEEEYTLTYQPQPLPSEGVICLGTGTVNDEGDLHIQNALDIGTHLPADYDENEEDAMLAVVIAADVDCEAGNMTNWVPEDYLFGDEVMFYVHSELEENDDEDDENGDD